LYWAIPVVSEVVNEASCYGVDARRCVEGASAALLRWVYLVGRERPHIESVEVSAELPDVFFSSGLRCVFSGEHGHDVLLAAPLADHFGFLPSSHFPEIGDGLRQYGAEQTHGGGVTSNGEVAETGEPFGQKKGGVEVRHVLLWATANERVEGFACGAVNVTRGDAGGHLVGRLTVCFGNSLRGGFRGHLRGREYLAEVVRCVERGIEEMNREGADGYPRTIG
jgi:hypothetical protein